jgi:hypothetical protein
MDTMTVRGETRLSLDQIIPDPEQTTSGQPCDELDASSIPWASFSTLEVYKPTTSGLELVPAAFRCAIRSGVNTPLPALTFRALSSFQVGKTPELVTVTHPHTLLKVTVPKLDEYSAMEDSISKIEWLEGWRILILIIGAELGNDMGEMFQMWHSCLQEHYLYQSDNDFPIIRRFDAAICLQFFTSKAGILLGEYLLTQIPKYEHQIRDIQLQAWKQSVISSLHSLQNLHTHVHEGSHSHQHSFPSSSQDPNPTLCCIICGKEGHRAALCSSSKTIFRCPIKSAWRNGKLVVASSGEPLCLFFNLNRCINHEHTKGDIHCCSLCIDKGHSAKFCHS